MSQIMKSLEQSQQGYNATQGIPSGMGAGVKHEPKKLSLAALITIAVVPSVLVASYVGYQTVTQWQSDTNAATLALAEQQKLLEEEQQKEPPKVYLSYPELGALKPFSEYKKRLPVKEKRLISVNGLVSEQASVSSETENDSEELQLSSLDLSSLSPELALRVQSALDSEKSSPLPAPEVAVVKLTDNEQQFSGALPAMNLQTHMYANSVESRWVKINGKELREGDWLDNEVQLIQITPRNIQVEFRGQRIEIPALHEWQG